MELLTALGLSLPAGLNAYIPLLAVAVAQRLSLETGGWFTLNEPYSILGEWWAIGLITVLLIVEVAADKFPAVDHINDVVNTLVRPAAGGLLAIAASGEVGRAHPWVMLACGIVLAGGVHAIKATSRPVINASTGGVGAPFASLVEDAAAAVTSVVAIVAPVVVAAVIALFGFLGWRWFAKRRARSAVTG